MPTGAIYGSGFLELSPRLASGFEQRINSDMRRVTSSMRSAGGEAGEAWGSQFEQNVRSDLESVVKWGKRGAVAIAGIGAAVAGVALKGGIDRALNIEDAQAKLRGLGHDMESVEAIMDSALASVKGTAFGLDAAATAAASAVAAGIEPGQELTRVLSLTADAATIMGRSFSDAGAIINKVLASNRLSMEEVNQLHDAGLPILSQLAEQYEVNAAAMRDMVSQGIVDSEAFLRALETNIAGAALESGETFRGALANVGAALSRVGETIVSPFLELGRDAFGGLTEGIDNLNTRLKPALEAFAESDFFETIQGHFERIPEYIDTAIDSLMSLWETTEFVRDGVGTAITGLVAIIDSQMGRAAIAIGGVKLAMDALKAHPLLAIATAAGFVAGRIEEHAETIAGFVDPVLEDIGRLNAAAREDVFRRLFPPEDIAQLETHLARSGVSLRDLMGTVEDFDHALTLMGRGGRDRSGVFWQQLGDEIDAQAQRLRDTLGGTENLLIESGLQAQQWAQRILTGGIFPVVEGMSSVPNRAARMGEEVIAALETAREGVGEKFADMTGSIDDFITGFEELPETADITMGEFITNLEERALAISTFYDNLAFLSAQGFDNLVADLEQQGPEAAGGLAESFAENLDKAEHANQVIGASHNLGETAAENLINQQIINEAIAAGKAIAEGVAEGINESAWMVVTATSSMLDTALQRGHNQIQAFSPSKVWEKEIGEPIPQGIAAGITGSAGDVTAALEDVLDPGGAAHLTANIRAAVETDATGGGVPRGGIIIEHLEVNNPQGEPTEESLASPYLAAAVSSYLR